MSTTIAKPTEREQFLLDVLICAAEGGINYWADVVGYRWMQGPATAKVVVRESDEDSGLLTVTIADVRRALGLLRRAKLSAATTGERVLGLNREDAARILEISATNGREDVLDAGDSDAVFQIAAFGEVVYC